MHGLVENVVVLYTIFLLIEVSELVVSVIRLGHLVVPISLYNEFKDKFRYLAMYYKHSLS